MQSEQRSKGHVTLGFSLVSLTTLPYACVSMYYGQNVPFLRTVECTERRGSSGGSRNWEGGGTGEGVARGGAK